MSRYECNLDRVCCSAAAAAAALFGLVGLPGTARAQTCTVDFTVPDCNTYQQVTTDSVDDGSTYTCDGTSYPGSEVTYEVTPPSGQKVVAYIDSATSDIDLDLLVQGGDCGTAGTCVGSSATAGNNEELSWTADGSTYYVTVDDKNGFGSYPFTFSLGCPTTCDPAADVTQTISCSTNIMETTAGGTHALDYYECGTPYSHLAQPNAESIYAFTPQQTGEVTFTLDNMTADQDLYVLEGSCGPDACIASSTDLDTNVDSVTFDAEAGTVYYIVVEAFGGEATYDLAFAIGPGGGCPEDCDNGADDDGDGQIDCDDDDCLVDPTCCDTDSDGVFGQLCGGDDCDDADSTSFPGADELCDSIDNDCDGMVDEQACTVDAGPLPPDAAPMAGSDAGPLTPDASTAPPTPDAGFGGGIGSDAGLGMPDSGCGCRAGSSRGQLSGFFLLLLALAATRRRRRRV